MVAQAVREKLMGERGNGSARAFVSGEKLREAAGYAKSARLALLNWTKQVYVNQENVDQNTDHVMEALAMVNQLENLRMRMEAKASLFGV